MPAAGTMSTIDYNRFNHGPLAGAMDLKIDKERHPLHSKRIRQMDVGDITAGEKPSYLRKIEQKSRAAVFAAAHK